MDRQREGKADRNGLRWRDASSAWKTFYPCCRGRQRPPLSFFMAAGQVSDHTGAAALLDDLPKA